MKTLGVTGGIGSGKTTVCRLLETMGARVFYADTEAKRIMTEHPEVRREIVDAFGERSYCDGALDRPYLAGIVFNDPAAVERINGIVHPRVFEAFRSEKERALLDGVPLLAHESALLFESGGAELVDEVAVVHAPDDLRLRRTVDRDGSDPEKVRSRMRNQLPQREMMRRADHLIENAGDVHALRPQVERLFRILTGSAPA